MISLDTGLRMEGLRALQLWDAVIDVLEPLASRARDDPSRQLKPETLKARQESSDRATPNMMYASHLSASCFLCLKASGFNGRRFLTLK